MTGSCSFIKNSANADINYDGTTLSILNSTSSINISNNGKIAINKVVDNNFYYDTKRMNSSVTRMGSTLATHDDNPPY